MLACDTWGMGPNLIQCPFCGSTTAPKVSSDLDLGIYEHHGGLSYTVLCDATPDQGGCGSTCGFFDYIDEAVEAWNTRADE